MKAKQESNLTLRLKIRLETKKNVNKIRLFLFNLRNQKKGILFSRIEY